MSNLSPPPILLRSRQPRFLATIGFALVLVSAACSSGAEGGYDVADRVIAAVGAPAENVVVFDSGCKRTLTVDEYGFESESVTCPDDQAPEPVEPDGLRPGDPINADQLIAMEELLPTFVYAPLAEAAPESVRSSFVELSPLLDDLDRVCGVDLEAWRNSLVRLLAVTRRLEAQLSETPPEDFIGTSPARALGRSLFERALFQPDCSAPNALPITVDDPSLDDLLVLTAGASSSVAEVDRLVSGSIMTRLFHFYSALPAYRWLRNPLAPVDVVVLGSSQAGAAIEVPDLSSRLGVSVGNAFLPGSLAEVQQLWISEVYRYASPSTIVWPMGPVDLLGTCITPGRAQQFSDRLANRQQTFAESGWFAGVDNLDVLLGRDTGFSNANMGNAPKQRSRNAEAIASQLPDYTNQFADPTFCADRAAVTAEVIAQLRSWGAEVVIVGMAVSPEAVDLIPGGRETIAASFEQLNREVIGPTGATFVDLSGDLNDGGLWADLTHLNQGGANRFTQLLADQFKVRGIGK